MAELPASDALHDSPTVVLFGPGTPLSRPIPPLTKSASHRNAPEADDSHGGIPVSHARLGRIRRARRIAYRRGLLDGIGIACLILLALTFLLL